MVDELFDELCALDQVEALALGGSRAGGCFDAASDYDVYVYHKGPVPAETRRAILSKYCSVLEIGNHFWEYEDNCRLNDGTGIDILYRDLDAFTADVAQVVPSSPTSRQSWNSSRRATPTPRACGTTCSPARRSMTGTAGSPKRRNVSPSPIPAS